MKVIHVLSDSNIGGAGVLLLNCLKHFNRKKFDLAVVLPRGAELVSRVKALSVPVIELENGADKSYDASAVGELKKIFLEEKPDIIHTHSSLSARIAARKIGVPLIFQTHHCAVEPPKYKTIFPIKQLLGAVNNRFSDCIVATAETARDILISQGTNKKKISVIINGSEPLRTPSIDEVDALRKKLGLSHQNFVVGIVARFETVKNHRILLDAASEAIKTHPEIRLVLLGKGSLETALKNLAVDLGISDKVIFCGFTDDTAPYVALFDVNVNCSISETSCLALSEAMSLGKASVVSDCKGNAAMIKNGETGLVFDAESSEALSTALITLAENGELLKLLGENAYRLYEEKFTAAAMTRQLEELYETMFENRKAYKKGNS